MYQAFNNEKLLSLDNKDFHILFPPLIKKTIPTQALTLEEKQFTEIKKPIKANNLSNIWSMANISF